ncbi:TonB-dependent receptor [Pelagibaculum spongiae]|uniref:TonB-dependent receptor n=1 Tax=Pelagibaculum spongiae TaxID=2080658 RepID=A0A2V1H3B8_9GAMM|nr:TonB-dependent receptor [Pelagibaculum spongiae]PVZ72470.1 hypothetical protein DC094_05555 [Pelagibaculum spongiae]
MKSIICSVALLAVYNTAYAEDERQKLPTVEVIGQQTSVFETDPDNSLQSVTVINRDQFLGKITSIPELLKQQTGIQIRTLGGHGSYSSYSVRGASGAQIGIYLNGSLLNDAAGASLDLSLINLSSVERIEIYKNYTPAIFARSNIGGAINIVTLKAKPQTDISLGLGSFSTKNLAIHHGETNSSFALSGITSDNDYSFYNSTGNFIDNKNQKRYNNELSQYQGYAYYRQTISDQKFIDYSLLLSDKNKNQPTLQNVITNDAYLKTKLAIANMLYSQPLFNGDLSVKASIYNRSEHFGDPSMNIGISKIKNQLDRNNRFEVTAGYNEYIEDISLTWVNRASIEKYNSHNIADAQRSQWERTELASAFSGQIEINPQWQSEATLAMEYYKDQQAQGMAQPTKSDMLYSGHFSLKFQPNYSHQIIANISKSHRLPGQRELFGNLGYSIANSDLEPEVAINSELAWQYDADNIGISTSLFSRKISNLIATIYDSRGIGRSENIARADINGLELNLNYQWGNLILASANTWQKSRQKSPFLSFDNKRLPGLFEFKQTISAQYAQGNWAAGIDYDLSDNLFHNRAEIAEPTTNIELWNAFASLKIGRHSFDASLLNLLDKEYILFNRYIAPGLEARISWRYQL